MRARVCAVLLVLGPAPATAAPDDELRCSSDSDCELLPPVCPVCAPCKSTLRPVGNRKAAAQRRRMQAVVDCAMPVCPPCASPRNWLGTPACVKKRCTAVARAECRSAGDCRLAYCCCDWLALPRGQPLPERCKRPCVCQPVKPRPRLDCSDARCVVATPTRPAVPPAPPPQPWSKDRACEKDADCVFLPWRACACPPCGDAWRAAVNRDAAALKTRDSCAKPACPRCPTRWLGSKVVCVNKQCTVR
jgi:hypothetical protein